MKKILIVSMGLGLLFFTGCGNSSTTKTETHTESSEVAEAGESMAACAVDGDTVVVNEGSTCKDGSHILSCENNVVTYDSFMHAPTIQINGRTYTCN